MSQYKLNPPTVMPAVEWLMLALLLEHKGFNEFFRKETWSDDFVAEALGLPSEMERCDNFRAEVRELLEARFKTLPKLTALSFENKPVVQQNIAKIADLLNFTAAEKCVFSLAVVFKVESILEQFSRSLQKLNRDELSSIIATLFALPKASVAKALSRQGKLFGYDLMDSNYNPDQIHEFLGWGEMLNFDEFVCEPLSERTLLCSCTEPTKKATLSLADFAHLGEMKSLMAEHLCTALENKRQGVNLLIYGAPGTGKTEFAELLAENAQVLAHNITYMDEDGEVISAKTRLNKCCFAQKILEGQSAVLIFDEIEDVFQGGFFTRSVAQENKAWMNNLLENNSVPIIWLSNSVHEIDPAFLRRFDLILEMPDLPLQKKTALIETLAEGKLSHNEAQHFANVRHLTPAMLSRTISVAKNLETTDFAETLRLMFNQTLKSQNKPKIEALTKGKAPYCLDWVSCSDDIQRISDGLKRTKKGRICCYGPPGTGKTAWATWLAESLDMPLLLKKGSDLLDPYVGGTERNIAQAFEQTKQDNALLVLDEVDTFLFSRESAERNWERSQVNEMLTQIERFEGLMVVSTNLMEVLDPAALRRFDLKLKFAYLSLEQRQAFAQEQAQQLGLGAFTAADLAQLASLNVLTPGDFAAVARRHRFAPFNSVADWLSALQGECGLKPKFAKAQSKLGFF